MSENYFSSLRNEDGQKDAQSMVDALENTLQRSAELPQARVAREIARSTDSYQVRCLIESEERTPGYLDEAMTKASLDRARIQRELSDAEISKSTWQALYQELVSIRSAMLQILEAQKILTTMYEEKVSLTDVDTYAQKHSQQNLAHEKHFRHN